MKKLLATVLISLPALAFSDTIGLHLASVHIPKNGYNNFNPGVYYIHDSGATVGSYYNSERRLSVYGGYTHQWGRYSLTVGAITGYKRSKVLPLVFPTVKVGDFRVGYIPKVEKTGSHVLHLMYEF